MFCKFIGGETAHRRCLVYFSDDAREHLKNAFQDIDTSDSSSDSDDPALVMINDNNNNNNNN